MIYKEKLKMINKAGYLKVKDIKKALENISDDTEVFIQNVINPCGNISELGKVEESTYSSFGIESPCIILKSVLLVEDEIEE
jgi:hypothetical protein